MLEILFAVVCLWIGVSEPAEPADPWQSLPFGGVGVLVDQEAFEGDTPGPWRVLDPGLSAPVWLGEGVDVEQGLPVMHLGMGDPMTSVVWADAEALPELMRDGEDYVLSFEAQRVYGSDFFVGLTFPMGDSHATLVLGGWGGATCGLSCINGQDASENATRWLQRFEDGQWYSVRLEVGATHVRVWVGDELKVNQPRQGHVFALRPEVEAGVPLSFATYRTEAKFRGLRVRAILP